MKEVLRQGAWLALAAWLSWWVFLRVPSGEARPRALAAHAPAMDVTHLSIVREPDPAPVQQVIVPEAAKPEVAEPEVAEAAGAPLSSAEERLVLPDPPPLQAPLAAPPAPDPTPVVAVRSPATISSNELHLETAGMLPAETLAEEPVVRASGAPAVEDESTAALENTAPKDTAPKETLPSVATVDLGTPTGSPDATETGASGAELRADDVPVGPAAAPTPVPELRAPPEPAAPTEDAGSRSVETLMNDPGLLLEARAEFERGEANGFQTVLLARPEDQLDIAAFFGEELVLVPRRAVVPGTKDPSYFRVSTTAGARVEAVSGAPALGKHRQYRDLFDYEYVRLPPALRELRRSVLARTEVYLFAALLSPAEWALVIARRQEALTLARRGLAEVRRFVLRYVHRPDGGFDIAVDEVTFADGSRHRPAPRGRGE